MYEGPDPAVGLARQYDQLVGPAEGNSGATEIQPDAAKSVIALLVRDSQG